MQTTSEQWLRTFDGDGIRAFRFVFNLQKYVFESEKDGREIVFTSIFSYNFITQNIISDM